MIPNKRKIKTKGDDINKFTSSVESLKCEKLALSFYRYVLQVHKKAQNSAVRGELGRAPLGFDIITHVLKFQDHLKSKDIHSILGEAFRTNKGLTKTRGQHWCQRCTNLEIFCKSTVGHSPVNLGKGTTIKKCLQQQYITTWATKLCNEQKMRTYKLFKHNFILEEYLSLQNVKHRSAMTKLRISAHRLAIELGRYQRPPIPLAERVCKHCPGDHVEER